MNWINLIDEQPKDGETVLVQAKSLSGKIEHHVVEYFNNHFTIKVGNRPTINNVEAWLRIDRYEKPEINFN